MTTWIAQASVDTINLNLDKIGGSLTLNINTLYFS